MILIKSDGYPTYNFANVVDDHLMGITHVVRGNEYISSSPKYNRLYDAFGWEVPKYIHCPLITDADHKKLSKRSGYSSYEDLIEQGFLPEAVVNFIALLGWSPENDNEIFSLDELVKVFDYHRIGKSPAVFDYTKLRWMNGEYLRRMDPEKFYEKALPYLRKVIHKDNLDLKTIAELVRTRIEIFPDMEEMVSFFEELPEYSADLFENKKQKATKENSLQILEELLPLFESAEKFTNDALFEIIAAYAEAHGFKNKTVIWAVRIAVSGREVTPAGATQIMEILGKEESLSSWRLISVIYQAILPAPRVPAAGVKKDHFFPAIKSRGKQSVTLKGPALYWQARGAARRSSLPNTSTICSYVITSILPVFLC